MRLCGSQLEVRFSRRRSGVCVGTPSACSAALPGCSSGSAGTAGTVGGEAAELSAVWKVVAAGIDAGAGVATAVTAAATVASLSAGSAAEAGATDAEAATGLSPSTISGALAIQTGQPSWVGTVRLRFVELTLGLGGWNCGLNTLGSEGVCRVNEGVRRAAFEEGVRLTGTLRLGEVACSATSSDSIAACRCVLFTGVFMAAVGRLTPAPRNTGLFLVFFSGASLG
jgi:hypothetical protein